MVISEFFKEFFNIIMGTFGILILLFALIIVLLFMAWLVKIEFEWFFETDLFKLLNSISDKFKVKFNKRKESIHKTVKFLNKKN